jgi:hypothetical protein
MRQRLMMAALAALLAAAALAQPRTAGAPNPPNASVVPRPAQEPKSADAPNPYADPEGVPACRQVCTPTACPAGQACAPFCYQECM